MMGSSAIINLVLGSSLSLLWGLINSLQLVTHFPLANVPYPDNAAIYFGALLELASFDLIPTDWAEDKIDD